MEDKIIKKPRLTRGSDEAKSYMAGLRSKRKGKVIPESELTPPPPPEVNDKKKLTVNFK